MCVQVPLRCIDRANRAMADVMVPMAVLNDRSFNPCPPNYEPLGLVSQVRHRILDPAIHSYLCSDFLQRRHRLGRVFKNHKPKYRVAPPASSER